MSSSGSVPRSSRRSRDIVHAELTVLLGDRGALNARPAAVQAFMTEDLLGEVADDYRALCVDVETDGKAVIVTAGPPGAGKSSALGSLLDGHRRIDPDEIKVLLLERLESSGLLSARLSHVLHDGEPVKPGELSWWVHEPANDVARLVRLQALQDGENFAMEGTLGWEGMSAVHVDELATYDYEELTVVDVEVSRAVAVEHVRRRWWEGRHDGSVIGGRFMADAAFDSFFPDRDEVSVTAKHARELYAAALDAGVETQLACLSRDAAGNERTALVSADGSVASWPVAGPYQHKPKAAVCIECGRPLTSDISIARGTGGRCAAMH